MIDSVVILKDMPTSVRGFVKEQDGYYTIVLNSRMTREKNLLTYMDEAYHIQNRDFDSLLQATEIEEGSHRHAKEI